MDFSQARMRQLAEFKHGPFDSAGWGVSLRHRLGYFSPDDYYEAVLDSLVSRDTEWLDVGGGSAVFPSNPKLARQLADRARRLVAVDPSSNVTKNQFAHEQYQVLLEDYPNERQFDLATARMVVEHVTNPESFVGQLGRLVRLGGKVVVYTVNRWAPMTILSGCTPMGVHHAAKGLLWNTEEKDTFPVTYLMNTRVRLNSLFVEAGFRETHFYRLDDCRTLAKWKMTLAAELVVWKMLRSVRIGYPESCLLGVYQRTRQV
jgi:2-polyprenyl-3-methyl-5-hydroxy-6-metoxy-1,4-benzoquinol methylase